MKKRLVLPIILISILIFAILMIITGNRVSGNPTNSHISNAVYNSIADNGSAQVLIRFTSQKQNLGVVSMLLGAKPSNYSATVSQIKDEIGDKRISYSGNGMIYANISSSQLSKLENISGITVTPETIYHITSESPTAQINVSAVQSINFNGENLTGQGQTVCVIDTGVYYSNPNLGGCYGYNNASSNCTVLGGYNFINNTDNPMDDNGHGTHVAGIIAANGALTGVAPGAKIIAIKACDSTGSCPEADIQAGLNWCVNNASEFNISVISMSIGSGDYSGYCNSDPLESEVNAAVAKNISVVAASGNDGNFTAMSSPACIQNVTAVGDTYVQSYSGTLSWGSQVVCSDTDPVANQIVCHSNRDSNLELLAPGALINSTVYPNAPVCGEGYCQGSYGQLGGTSMAAPHVSGAIAILKQYLQLNSQSLSPSKAQSALNETGKKVYDSKSGLTFSLINVESALISLDTQPPKVNLLLPVNSSITSQKNQTFECNSSDLFLKQTTLKIWNSTGLYYNSTKPLSGQSQIATFNKTLPNYETYNWNCLSEDINSNTAYSVQNSTLTISPGVIYLSPTNNTYTNKNQTFSCNSTYLVSGPVLSNVTFSIFNSSDSLVYNKTEKISGTSNKTYYDYNFTSQGSYLWGCDFYTNENNFTSSGNYTITYDTTSPNVTLVSPANDSNLSGGTQDVNFKYNSTDNFQIGNCSLYINNQPKISNSTIISKENDLIYSLSPGTYSWKIGCFDKADNYNETTVRKLTIESVPTSSSSGGGPLGGSLGGSPLSPEPTAINETTQPVKNIINGYSIALPEEASETFILNNSQNHTITINNIFNQSANITIRSSPITFVLYVNQEKYLNLSSPDYYDLLVKLNSIENEKANLTIKELTTNNRIFHTVNKPSAPQTNQGFSDWIKKYSEQISIIGGILIFLLLVASAIVYFANKKKRKMEEKIKAKKLKPRNTNKILIKSPVKVKRKTKVLKNSKSSKRKTSKSKKKKR